jgi:hypothetical protein
MFLLNIILMVLIFLSTLHFYEVIDEDTFGKNYKDKGYILL